MATGNGPYDVVTHTNTSDKVMGIHIAPSPADSPSGAFKESYADLLITKGFDGGQPIVYLSTDAGQPLTAVLERSTYVPALNDASFNGCDDFLGSARERLFGFVNGQTGVGNSESQGFQHFAKDSPISENAVQTNTTFINAMRYGGDILNVFGDFPTLNTPRHADAYSPLWDAQLGLWTPKAVKEGLNKRQINENQVLNMAFSQPDLLTGVNPATGKPQLYGSVGVNINCAVIGYTAKAPQPSARPTCQGPSSRPGSWQAAAGTLRPGGRTGGTAPEAPGGPAMAGPPVMRKPSGRSRCSLLHQEAMAVGPRYQGGVYPPVQDHEVIVGQGHAAAGERGGGCVERRDPHHAVRRHDVVAGRAGRDRQACARVVVQQFHPWGRQSRASRVTLTWTSSTSSRAACSGPRFSVRAPALNPNTDPKNSRCGPSRLRRWRCDRHRERSRCR